MDIGITLSGGGFRALVFHLGVFARLAQEQHLEKVTYLSSVSGGSLAAGLIFAENNYQWPSSQDYLENVLPKVRKQVITNGLKRPLLFRQLRRIFTIFDTRADDMAELIQERWRININLDQLPKKPRWMINATCYETGKNWRFERFRMGDYVFGYTFDTNFQVSKAMAASAAFPGAIGPLVLDTEGRSWFKYKDEQEELAPRETQGSQKTQPITPEFKNVHLWDGGVYDNLGLEGLHDFRKGWPKIDFLIVSDATGTIHTAGYKSEVTALVRMVSQVMKNQIRALQSRAVLERIIDHTDRGSYLQTGNYCQKILQDAWQEKIGKGIKRVEDIDSLCEGSLKKEEAEYCAGLATDIDDMPEMDFELVFQHGFEVANATLYGYNDDLFKFIKYSALS